MMMMMSSLGTAQSLLATFGGTLDLCRLRVSQVQKKEMMKMKKK